MESFPTEVGFHSQRKILFSLLPPANSKATVLSSIHPAPKKKVTIKAVLKNNPAIWREVTIYVKTTNDNERLKTIEEVLQPSTPRKKKSR